MPRLFIGYCWRSRLREDNAIALTSCPLIAGAAQSTVKVVPAPARLTTATLPPRSTANSLTSASPRPVPSKRRVDVSSSCLNFSNKYFWFSSEIPMPVSATDSDRWSFCQVRATSIRPPCGVNLTAFERRLKRIRSYK